MLTGPDADVLGAAGFLSETTITASAPRQHAYAPQVAVDRRGSAVLAWQGPVGATDCAGAPGCSRIHARTLSAAGIIGANITTLSDMGQNADSPAVAVDQDDDAVSSGAVTTD